MEIKAVQVYTPEDCYSGSCDCEGAENCKFPRCSNCDAILNKDGKWIDDNGFHKWEIYGKCPDCGGPLDN